MLDRQTILLVRQPPEVTSHQIVVTESYRRAVTDSHRSVAVRLFTTLSFSLATVTLGSCGLIPQNTAGAQPNPNQSQQAPAVDVAIASQETLGTAQEFIGTTEPVREVSLRSQVEGRIININARVGEVVTQGQILAQLDDAILLTNVVQAEAQVAALEAEVSRARSQVSTAAAQAEQARLEVEQARRDSDRLSALASDGAISQQQAEQSRTSQRTQEQLLNAALARISTEEENVAAAIRRVEAQQAVVAQARERQSLTLIPSPLDGVVLERISEPGNLLQPGNEVMKLGDFSSVKVVALVSELDLSKVQMGRSVQVRLDAFPDQNFTGRVSSISPSADPVSRQIPVEVTVPNASRRITGGLLARLSFNDNRAPRVVVPQSAIPELARGGASGRPSPNPSASPSLSPDNRSPSTSPNSSPGSDRPNSSSSPNSSNSSTSSPGARSGSPAGASPNASPNSGNRAGASSGNSPNASRPATGSGNGATGGAAPREVTLFVVVGEGEEAKAEARKVTIGARANGKVEIISGLAPGERFIVRSTRPLKDGEKVRLSRIASLPANLPLSLGQG
jgi:HlyD family secretion protein